MNGGELLVDTNIIIYLVSGDQTVSEILEAKSVYLSFITKIELFAFKQLKRQEDEVIKSIIDNSNIIYADYKITEAAINFRRKYNLKLPDAVIAASAETHGLPLVTADTGFARLTELNIVQYKGS